MTDLEISRWVAATLANDESSTDAELIEYFIENGLNEKAAREFVSKRGEFLK